MQTKKFSIFDSIVFGFKALFDNIALFLLSELAIAGIAMLLLLLVGLAGGFMFKDIFKLVEQLKGCHENCWPIVSHFFAFVWDKIVIILLVFFVALMIKLFIILGYNKMALQVHDTHTDHVSTLFSCFHLLPKYIVISCLYLIIVSVGLALLIVPGLYLMARFSFCTLFLVDKNTGIIDSLRASYELTHGQGWHVFGLLITIAIVLSLTGPFVIVLFPISFLAHAYAYRSLLAEARPDHRQ